MSIKNSVEQKRAIDFIIKDVRKWKRQLPVYFVGNVVIVSLSLFCICFGVISYIMIGGISTGDRSIYTGESGGQYFAVVSGVILFGISVLSIAGKNFIRNAGSISLFLDGKTKFERPEAELALQIIQGLPRPVSEIEQERKRNELYDRIFTLLLMSNLVQENEWNYIKSDYIKIETEIETEDFIEELRIKNKTASSIKNLNSQMK